MDLLGFARSALFAWPSARTRLDMSIDTLEALYIGQAAGHVLTTLQTSLTAGFEAEARSTWRTVPLGVSVGLLFVISWLVTLLRCHPEFLDQASKPFQMTFTARFAAAIR